MTHEYEIIEKVRRLIEPSLPLRPKIAVVLGSGLGALAEEIEDAVCFDYDSLPDFPRTTVQGHRGRFVFGKLNDIPVAVMQGRIHYYEGYDMQTVVRPIRVLAALGCRTIILTNAAGGIGDAMSPCSFMLIRDHIAAFVPSPLRAENDERIGTRFPDMSTVYRTDYRTIIKNVANNLQIPLAEGVYLQAAGPQYETPAEILMYQKLGADAVGMSTAVEAIAARHAGLSVVGISLITNKAAGLSENKLSHEEVTAAADQCAARFQILIKESVRALSSVE